MNEPKFITLDNGLTVLMYSDKSKITNHVELITFLGSLNLDYQDKDGNLKEINQGTAHLLEHYICECNKNGNLIDNLYKLKALNANASTSQKVTNMYFETVYNFKESLISLLNSIYNVEFTKEKLDKTKYAVYNEIRDAKDNPKRKIFDEKVKMNYGKKISTLGSKTSVKNITSKSLEAVYKTFYVPKNQFLVIAGSFEEKEILELINEFYSNYKFENNKRHYGIKGISKTETKEIYLKGNSINEVIVSYKINIEDKTNFERYKLDWYLSYFTKINLSKYSQLNEELKKDNIITGNISSCIYNINGYIVLETIAYAKDTNKFIEKVKNTINNPIEDSKDFDLVKKNSVLELSVRKDNISSTVSPVMENYIEFDYPYNDKIEFTESLDYDEYKETINSLELNKYSILTIKESK